jgi:hypothetical protein
VISDQRGLLRGSASPVVKRRADGSLGYMPIRIRPASEYLAAALPLGLRLLRCEEPETPPPLIGEDGTDLHTGEPSPEHVPGGVPNIWALHPFCIEATSAAWQGKPAAIVRTSSWVEARAASPAEAFFSG